MSEQKNNAQKIIENLNTLGTTGNKVLNILIKSTDDANFFPDLKSELNKIAEKKSAADKYSPKLKKIINVLQRFPQYEDLALNMVNSMAKTVKNN